MRRLEAIESDPATTGPTRCERVAPGRPEGLIEHGLLAHAESFGAELAKMLVEARELVLREGDAHSREALRREQPTEMVEGEIRRLRRTLAGVPAATERSSPALVRVDERMVIALAHPVPAAGHRLSVHMQADIHRELTSTGASRIKPDAELLLRWSALGHTRPPDSAWSCEAPRWLDGTTGISLAIELMPNPSSFNEAVLIAHQGAGRVLIVREKSAPTDDASDAWRSASVLSSGWPHLRGSCVMGSADSGLPNGAPYLATSVRIPDDDLFALCAAKTWPASLRDSIWLQRRLDIRLLRGNTTPNQGENP
jgi:hypothetical protein